MKRLRDASIEESAKRIRPNSTEDLQQEPSEPLQQAPDLWRQIASHISNSDSINLKSTSKFFNSLIHITRMPKPWQPLPEPALWEQIVSSLNSYQSLNLLSTSNFFTNTFRDEYKEQIFLKAIKNCIFDYPNKSELDIALPIDARSFNIVKNRFVSQLKNAMPAIEALQYVQEMVKQHNPNLEEGFHSRYGLLKTDSNNFLKVFNAAIREGNLLILNELKKTLPFYMKHCIDEPDHLDMTPFAHAAANDRDIICSEILERNLDPFQQVINYDLGAAFVFSMRSIHILALRSNKNFLITLFNEYFDTLTGIFDENFRDALSEILNNKVESLKKRLDEDDSLLETIDDGSWTLMQWASCFPDSINCLQLLLDKKAAINGDESPPIAYIACAAGNFLALQKLLAKGESFEPLENGNSLLHLSVYLGHYEIAEMLITNYKLDVNAANERDETPLVLAEYTTHNGMELSSVKLDNKSRCVELLYDNNAKGALNNTYLG